MNLSPKISLFFLLFTGSINLIYSQQFHFNSSPEIASPDSSSKHWAISYDHNKLYIIYQNPSPLDTSQAYFLDIIKMDTTYFSYDMQDTLFLDSISARLTWEREFYMTGNYLVTIQDSNSILAKDTLFVRRKVTKTNPQRYRQARLIAASTTKAKATQNTVPSPGFSVSEDIYIHVFNNQQINSDELTVDIWLTEKGHKNLIETKRLQIDFSWKTCYFKLNPEKSGYYTIQVYNSENVFIGKCSFEVHKI